MFVTQTCSPRTLVLGSGLIILSDNVTQTSDPGAGKKEAPAPFL